MLLCTGMQALRCIGRHIYSTVVQVQIMVCQERKREGLKNILSFTLLLDPIGSLDILGILCMFFVNKIFQILYPILSYPKLDKRISFVRSSFVLCPSRSGDPP